MIKKECARRIILDLAVTLDGFIEGLRGEVDWCIMNPDMNFNNFLNDIDTILYGRKSYDLWGQYLPEKGASDTEKELWESVHSKKKFVFSNTLAKVNGNATLISNNIKEEIKRMKNEQGKNIWLYGGASLITSFVNLGLVDEYRLSVHPVILGAGKPLFADINHRVGLKLVGTRKFASGVVQLCYQDADK